MSIVDNIINAILDIFRGRKEDSVPPPPPVGRKPEVPSTQDDVLEEEPSRSESPALGQALFIKYKDSKGQISERRISIKAVMQQSKGPVVRAFCFERKAVRAFKVDRIVELHDLGTGEVFDDTDDIYAALGFKTISENLGTREDRILFKYKDEITTLAFLARCDGDFSIEEEDVILDYLKDLSTERLKPGDLRKKIKGMAPAEDAFEESLSRLSSTSLDHIENLVDASISLVEADDKVTPEEEHFLVRLEQVLGR